MNNSEFARAYDWQTDRLLDNLQASQETCAQWYEKTKQAFLNERLSDFADDFFCFQETKEDRENIQQLMNEFVKMIYTEQYDFTACLSLMKALRPWSVDTMNALIEREERNMPF